MNYCDEFSQLIKKQYLDAIGHDDSISNKKILTMYNDDFSITFVCNGENINEFHVPIDCTGSIKSVLQDIKTLSINLDEIEGMKEWVSEQENAKDDLNQLKHCFTILFNIIFKKYMNKELDKYENGDPDDIISFFKRTLRREQAYDARCLINTFLAVNDSCLEMFEETPDRDLFTIFCHELLDFYDYFIGIVSEKELAEIYNICGEEPFVFSLAKRLKSE